MQTLEKLQAALLAVIASCLLIACGGGGGGNTTTGVTTLPLGTTFTAVVSGVVRYERVGFSAASGALNYGNISALPVRGATVELVFAGNAIASTQTNASGQYSFSAAPNSTTLAIRVRAELKQASGAAQWDVSVRDNTNADALYTMQSVNFNSGAGASQNLTAASGWGGASYTSARVAGPFAILDTIYESQQKVLSAQPNTIFPVLKVFWSINNNTGSGQLITGDIGTSFFTELSNGMVVSERRMYILGRENNDTDEYDGSVVAHEWGHYYQSALSRDDSMGGRHGGGDDRLDRRIAFSEGWGNAWSGIAQSRNSYSDSSGNSQGSGFVLALNSGYNTAFGGVKGWFREQSIQYIIWSLSAQAGFQGVHQTLTGNTFRTGAALSDIHSFAAAYRSTASATSTSALNLLLSSESINTNSDMFGSAENNNGGNSATLPYYRQISALGNPVVLSGGQTICTTAQYTTFKNSSSASDGDRNKLGYFAYARFSLASAATRTITVVGSPASGVDADFEIHSAGQRVAVAEIATNQTETLTNAFAAGDYVLVMYDFNKVSPANTCYSVSIQ